MYTHFTEEIVFESLVCKIHGYCFSDCNFMLCIEVVMFAYYVATQYGYSPIRSPPCAFSTDIQMKIAYYKKFPMHDFYKEFITIECDVVT